MNPQSQAGESPSLINVAPLADAGRLIAMIDGLNGCEPGGQLTCAVQEIVRILGGEAGVCLLASASPRVRGSTQPRWADEHLDVESCRGLTAAMQANDLIELPTGEVGIADATVVTRELLLVKGRLTVVPLNAGSELLGWMLVRSVLPLPPPLDEMTRVTALIAARMVAAFVCQQAQQAQQQRAWRPETRSPRTAILDPPSTQVTPVWGTPITADRAHRVVVVEDDTDVASGLRVALESEGYEVEVASTVDQAMGNLRQSAAPSIVILDVSLPDGDGFAIAKSLAANRRTAHVPVLFLSGSEDLATRVRSLHRDEADFLQKPFAWKELLTRVAQLILRAEHHNQLLFSARSDELTGLGNRRLLEERLATEAARIDRYGTPLSIAILDVDRLKFINDRHGHAAGSSVLRAIGDALRRAVRETDLAARYGGDEFVVLLPHTDVDQATLFAQRVLATLRTLQPSGLPVSVSIGVASFDEKRDASVEDLFERADQTAYRAKREGGNRVCVDRTPT